MIRHIEALHAKLLPGLTSWSPEQFEDYLILASEAGKGVFDLEQFPEQIHLSKRWHAFLNGIRDKTLGVGGYEYKNFEHFDVVGTRAKRVALGWSMGPSVGTQEKIPGLMIGGILKYIENEGEMDYFASLVHSHPPEYRRDLLKRKRFDRKGFGFSPGDIISFLTSKYCFPLDILVEGASQTALFRTIETSLIDSSQVEEEIWSMCTSRSKSRRELNMEIAEKFGLVLYIGSVNQPLKRIFP